MKIYQSSKFSKIHLVTAGRLFCSPNTQVKDTKDGKKEDVTCLNCKWRFNCGATSDMGSTLKFMK